MHHSCADAIAMSTMVPLILAGQPSPHIEEGGIQAGGITKPSSCVLSQTSGKTPLADCTLLAARPYSDCGHGSQFLYLRTQHTLIRLRCAGIQLETKLQTYFRRVRALVSVNCGILVRRPRQKAPRIEQLNSNAPPSVFLAKGLRYDKRPSISEIGSNDSADR